MEIAAFQQLMRDLYLENDKRRGKQRPPSGWWKKWVSWPRLSGGTTGRTSGRNWPIVLPGQGHWQISTGLIWRRYSGRNIHRVVPPVERIRASARIKVILLLQKYIYLFNYCIQCIYRLVIVIPCPVLCMCRWNFVDVHVYQCERRNNSLVMYPFRVFNSLNGMMEF